ncbi:hypothetical protein ISS98_21100 [Dyella flagellata]
MSSSSESAASHIFDIGNDVGTPLPNYLHLARGLPPLNAHILLGRLKVNGVDAHLSGENIVQMDPLWFYALGGVRIFVRSEHIATALDVINAIRKGDYDVTEAEEMPASGTDRLDRKRLLGWKIVLLVALLIGGLSLVVLWWPPYELSFHAIKHVPPSDLSGRRMASALLLAYAAFWLLFVEGVVRRQRRP